MILLLIMSVMRAGSMFCLPSLLVAENVQLLGSKIQNETGRFRFLFFKIFDLLRKVPRDPKRLFSQKQDPQGGHGGFDMPQDSEAGLCSDDSNLRSRLFLYSSELVQSDFAKLEIPKSCHREESGNVWTQ
jgi:hypothetical protein